jgi:hypothetical protein
MDGGAEPNRTAMSDRLDQAENRLRSRRRAPDPKLTTCWIGRLADGRDRVCTSNFIGPPDGVH